MATISTTGLGSGLDIQGMVTKLVAAEGQGQTLQLNTRQAHLQADLSALGTLKSALTTFQTSVQGLEGASTFQVNTATSGNPAVFTASANGSATPGSFSITVDQLGQFAQMSSASFTSDTALVGAGTLAINLGTTSFNITTDGTTTLAGVRDAINQASTNPGIKATIINVNTGSQLVLTSSQMGAANTIGIAATPTTPSPGNDLTRLATASLTTTQTAADAIIHVNGQLVTRTTNSISDVIPGITLNLNTASTTPATLNIASDPTSTTTKIQGFVSAYNTLQNVMNGLSSYDTTTKQGGPLMSDATLRGIKNQIRQALSNPVQGGVTGFSTLAAIGITTDKTGALVLDSTKLNIAMASNPAAVSTLFASTSGLATRVDTILTNYLSFNGTLSTRLASDNKQIGGVTDDLAKLNVRLTTLQNRYLAQFNAMDALVGQFQSTGVYLTQQFANLPGFTNTTKG